MCMYQLTDYGRETPIGVIYIMYVNGNRRQMASKQISSTSLQSPAPSLWLAADRRYSVMTIGGVGSNQVGVTNDF